MMDTYLTISQAAQFTHVSELSLYQQVRVGKIRSVITISGEILVNEKDVQPQLSREQFAHLAGQPIGMREAEQKYGVRNETISTWVKRGKIKVIQRGGRGQRTLIDEADIAYEAAKYLQDPGRGKRTDLR